MKTMKKGDKIIRVKNDETDIYINKGYKYCPKKLWKDENERKAIR